MRDFADLREQARAMYAAGVRRREIEIALGLAEWTVRKYTQDMPRSRPYADPGYLASKKLQMPVGRFGLTTDLTPDQAVALENLAVKWGCETLAEAALEILRDELEKHL